MGWNIPTQNFCTPPLFLKEEKLTLFENLPMQHKPRTGPQTSISLQKLLYCILLVINLKDPAQKGRREDKKPNKVLILNNSLD